MGRGNWFPGFRTEDCRVIYIDYSNDEIEADDADMWMWEWESVEEIIKDCLPDSFTFVSDYRDFPHHLRQGYAWRDCSPLAYSGLFTLWCDSQGDNYHQGIGFTVNEDAPAFAASKLDATADKFFAKLSQCLRLSVRTSAWTSAPYKAEVMQ